MRNEKTSMNILKLFTDHCHLELFNGNLSIGINAD